MKTPNSIVLLLILLFVSNSCKKDPAIDPAKDITGQWRWFQTYAVAPDSDTNPLTPQNTGIQEVIVFNADHTWFNMVNGIKTDFGTYTSGHGTYTPYQGARIYIYDSIAYSRNDIKFNIGDYYEIRNDTLQFCPGYAGRFNSYTLPTNGSKFWKKEITTLREKGQ